MRHYIWMYPLPLCHTLLQKGRTQPLSVCDVIYECSPTPILRLLGFRSNLCESSFLFANDFFAANFLLFVAFCSKKCWKWQFWPAFGVCSTQTLVKIYNIPLSSFISNSPNRFIEVISSIFGLCLASPWNGFYIDQHSHLSPNIFFVVTLTLYNFM